MKRKIISIDRELCTGCGECIPDCPEGALQIIGGKARLISDLFCDGLGACIGTCPEGAITIIEREAAPYDEWAVMRTIVSQGEEVIQAHLAHLDSHDQMDLYQQAITYLQDHDIPVPYHERGPTHPLSSPENCPGAASRGISQGPDAVASTESETVQSELQQWPVQLRLINPAAPCFDDADLLVSADCVPFAYAGFHADLLKGRVLIIFCPKLDSDIEGYVQKLVEIFTLHSVRSITVAHMEVPCCSGLRYVVERALEEAGVEIPITEKTITIQGEIT
ncbi:MAG: 4Fe-4S dicluster domain-containing protein [Methanocalculus sp.]|uniref:ATP-binding protein n=1 Tax=Methanocalculus sp. TaxID=2004547 RepID=UPI00272652EF|nr:4Fe-4S dicluster domain-containing protein [Methanocalculus sp.]MDO9539951.1 4Fe-4S dicluster domain-containing protein [Methanocalculus sp.]